MTVEQQFWTIIKANWTWHERVRLEIVLADAEREAAQR